MKTKILLFRLPGLLQERRRAALALFIKQDRGEAPLLQGVFELANPIAHWSNTR
jgi:hypothetical protein